MSTSCAILVCVLLGAVSSAPNPSVFQRNGLQREQEGALHREPFEPQSPFQISHGNVQSGNTLVVPPTIDLDTTYTRPAISDSYLPQGSPSRTFLNHFEILNKDALVGLLIEKDIPFYVKTIVEPMKPVQTKIHVMRIPKKYETTSPLPDINLNMVEIVNMNATHQDKDIESYNTDTLQQVKTLIELDEKVKGYISVSQKGDGNGIVKVMETRPEDTSAEQETPLITVTDSVQSPPRQNEPVQNDDPNAGASPSSTPVYEHAIIYTPDKRPDSKTIWEHIGSAYDKAKEKTTQLVGKAKDKTDQLIEKAKEKAKDVLDSDETNSKEKGPINPADDI